MGWPIQCHTFGNTKTTNKKETWRDPTRRSRIGVEFRERSLSRGGMKIPG
jgi:hypothetical protein